MQNDEIDEMLTGAGPPSHPSHRRGSPPHSLTEPFVDPVHGGHFEEDQEIDRTMRNDPPRARDPFSEDVAAEILSRTNGTKDAGDDFLTAATRAVEHAVRRVAAESRDPAGSAGAILAGVLRGAGENEDMALKILSLAAGVVLREALLLGYGPTSWIQGILSGAVVGAEDRGLDRENAVSAATQGILKGADERRFGASGVTGRALERTIQAALDSSADPARRSEA
jgi:hypothetical protein